MNLIALVIATTSRLALASMARHDSMAALSFLLFLSTNVLQLTQLVKLYKPDPSRETSSQSNVVTFYRLCRQ
jgi:hypothetical protein